MCPQEIHEKIKAVLFERGYRSRQVSAVHVGELRENIKQNL